MRTTLYTAEMVVRQKALIETNVQVQTIVTSEASWETKWGICFDPNMIYSKLQQVGVALEISEDSGYEAEVRWFADKLNTLAVEASIVLAALEKAEEGKEKAP